MKLIVGIWLACLAANTRFEALPGVVWGLVIAWVVAVLWREWREE